MAAPLRLEALSPTPELEGNRVRLRALTLDVLDDYQRMLDDPDGRHLTGTHATFPRHVTESWLAGRRDAAERADWGIHATEDGRFLGEVVLFDIDRHNRSGGFRIALAGPHEYGKGFGTEATELALDVAFGVVGLHRVSLEVFAFNERAQASYRKSGFVEEGRLRDALRWDGEWHDALVMSVLAPERAPATR